MRTPLASVVIVVSLLAGSAADAQVAATATVVEAPGASGLRCGGPLGRSYKIKNTGTAPLTSKITLNGQDTPFTLAPAEEKSILASGGNYNCTTTLEYSVSIPSPTAGAAPLFQNTYKPKGLVYNYGDHLIGGGRMDVRALAWCGAPVAVTFKNSSFMAKQVSGSFKGQSFNATVPGNGTRVVSLQPLNCASPISPINYEIGVMGGLKLTATNVNFT
jgi:hypothetical protein